MFNYTEIKKNQWEVVCNEISRKPGYCVGHIYIDDVGQAFFLPIRTNEETEPLDQDDLFSISAQMDVLEKIAWGEQ